MFADLIGTDRRLAEQVTVLMAPWKGSVFNFMTYGAQACHENVLQRGLVHTQVSDAEAALAADFVNQVSCRVRIVRQHIQAVAESLDVEKRLSAPGKFVQDLLGVSQFRGTHLDALRVQACAQ